MFLTKRFGNTSVYKLPGPIIIASASEIASTTPGAATQLDGLMYILCISVTLSYVTWGIFSLPSTNVPSFNSAHIVSLSKVAGITCPVMFNTSVLFFIPTDGDSNISFIAVKYISPKSTPLKASSLNLKLNNFFISSSWSERATMLPFISPYGRFSLFKSDIVTIAVILFVYFFKPFITVFIPFPPPITTTFGPSSYMVLLKINPLIFKFDFFPFLVNVVFASIRISNIRFCIYINPITIAVKPPTKDATIFIISFGLSIFASIILAIAKQVRQTPIKINNIHFFIFVFELNQLKNPFIKLSFYCYNIITSNSKSSLNFSFIVFCSASRVRNT